MSISLKPKKARVISGKDAWWYDEKNSITVCIQPREGGNAIMCSIRRSELLKYIKRSRK